MARGSVRHSNQPPWTRQLVKRVVRAWRWCWAPSWKSICASRWPRRSRAP